MADSAGSSWRLLLFPEQASEIAGRVDALFWALTLSSALVVLVIFGVIVTFCIRYRKGSQTERRALHGSRALEFGWSIPVLIAFVVFFVWSALLYVDIYDPPAAEGQKINVIAKQWMWKFQHPEGVREINDLHVPVGTTVSLRMISQDVIHSFYVPAFRVKNDVLPGRYTSLSFTATRPGKYHLFCAEFCGLEHAKMKGRVIALAPADYQAWLESQSVAATPAQTGAALFRQYGCSGCHSAGSTVRAPALAGVFGKPVQLADGGSVIADERYLRDAMLLPNREVVAGYAPLMPSFQGQLSEDDVLNLIAYLKSLSAARSESDAEASPP